MEFLWQKSGFLSHSLDDLEFFTTFGEVIRYAEENL